MSFGRRATSLLDGRSSNEDNTRTEKQGPLVFEVIQVHHWGGVCGVKDKDAENRNDFSQETLHRGATYHFSLLTIMQFMSVSWYEKPLEMAKQAYLCKVEQSGEEAFHNQPGESCVGMWGVKCRDPMEAVPLGS